jgi:KDO2-lipid IV(A) lauroyltransferase
MIRRLSQRVDLLLWRLMGRGGERAWNWFAARCGAWLLQSRADSTAIVMRNLELCFPQFSEMQRQQLALEQAQNSVRGMLYRYWSRYASRQQLLDRIELENPEKLHAYLGQPLVVFSGHFFGFDAVAQRLALEYPKWTALYEPTNDPIEQCAWEKSFHRYSDVQLIANTCGSAGLKKVIRQVKSGVPFYVLTDRSPGANQGVVDQMFGWGAWTSVLPALLAKECGAVLLPMSIAWSDDRCKVRFHAPLDPHHPSEPIPRQMNCFFEQTIRQTPAWYTWTHPRFSRW